MKFTIGADPEIFVKDAQSLRSIIGKVGGTKTNPLPLILGDGFAVQEDNVAMEFNVPPASNREEFVHNISRTVRFLNDMVRDMYGFTISNLSAASFPDSELQSEAAHVFGCDPDYNAWTGYRNPSPKADDPNLRSCGGHVHVGFTAPRAVKEKLIRAMDLHLGVPSVIMDNGEKRKKLYGKAGAYRLKPFGVEYRTLSNFWIFDDDLIRWVYDNTNRALTSVAEEIEIEEYGEMINNAINNNDKDLAWKLANSLHLDVRT